MENTYNIELSYLEFIQKKMIEITDVEINPEIINIINLCALEMYKIYMLDNELDTLEIGEDDWFREFMPDYLFNKN